MTQPQQPEDLTDEQRHDLFISRATAEGNTTVENAENVWKIVTELSPGVEVQHIEAFGMDLGCGALRVAREYDGELTEAGFEGFTEVQLQSPLGLVRFSVRKTDLLGGLTVEVPHVSPPKAREES